LRQPAKASWHLHILSSAAMGNSSQKKPTGKLRKKFSVFLLCLLISMFMWLFIKLTRDYTLDFRFSINYKNFPKHLVLSEVPDSLLTIGLNAKGFELLSARYLHGKRNLMISCRDERIRHNSDGYFIRIAVSRLLPQISKQLPASRSITYLSPDTITLRFTDASRKKVPVILRLTSSFRKQYQLYDRVRLDPDSVFVTAASSVLDTLRFIESMPVTKTNLDESLRFPLALKLPLSPGQLRLSAESVEVFIPVEKYTEADFSVPIEVKGASSKTLIKTFPDKCTITCMVPLKDFRNINAGMFSAGISFNPDQAKNNKLKVELTRSPQKIKILKISPEEVEFIILKK
jgi:hypothetical protein